MVSHFQRSNSFERVEKGNRYLMINRVLISIFELSSSDPIQSLHEMNVISTCRFVFHELWWFQHESTREVSDSNRVRVGSMCLV